MRNNNFITHSHNQISEEANYSQRLSSANTVETTQIRCNLMMLSECDVKMSQISAYLIDQLLMSQISAHLIDQLSMSQISAHLIDSLSIRSQKPTYLRRKIQMMMIIKSLSINLILMFSEMALITVFLNQFKELTEKLLCEERRSD